MSTGLDDCMHSDQRWDTCEMMMMLEMINTIITGCLGVSWQGHWSYPRGHIWERLEGSIPEVLGNFFLRLWEILWILMWTGGTILRQEAEPFHVLGRIPFTSQHLHFCSSSLLLISYSSLALVLASFFLDTSNCDRKARIAAHSSRALRSCEIETFEFFW